MLKNYITIAWRNLMRNKVFSFINLTGLSIGLACCLLIVLFAKDELSFDRFHKDIDQLYQLTCRVVENNGKESLFGIASHIQGPTFAREIPEIEKAVRVSEVNFIVRKGEETFEEKVSFADPDFFEVFSFPLMIGDPEQVLEDTHSMVLSEEMANKYFGETDPVGETLDLMTGTEFESFVVTGVAKRAPENSSIKFNILLSFKYNDARQPDNHWLNLNFPTYLVLNKNADIPAVVTKMARSFKANASQQIEEEKKRGLDAQFQYGLEPFQQVHLNKAIMYRPEPSDPIYAYILSGIALFLLLIACINFINLTVAKSLKRGKEIGIRKVVGGERRQLILQFLGESFILCLISFSLALILANLALPIFNDLSNKRLEIGYLFDYKLVISFAVLFLLTVLAAGFYPALVLSGFDPVKTLYNRMTYSGRNYLAKGLIIFQFCLTTLMLITTLFINNQFHYLTHEDLGYDDKNLMVLNLPYNTGNSLAKTIQNEIMVFPGVNGIGTRQEGFWGTNSRANGFDIPVNFDHIDSDYLPTMKIRLAEGRNFSPELPGDSVSSVLVNQAFVKAAGWKGSAIGKTIDFFNGQDANFTIVGVVKNYHFGSLKQEISPQVFTMQPGLPFSSLMIKISPERRVETIAAIQELYQSKLPYHPFKYDFLEDLNKIQYQQEARWKQIVGIGALLMIFISSIGLFGLTLLSIQQKTKEIGIRKILGASIFQIARMLTRNFLGLIFISFAIAIPVAWYVTETWLENFAYRIDITWEVFVLSAGCILLIALATISYQTFRAANLDPAKNLRVE